MILKDYLYFRRRALQEDEAARGAACDAARERHEQLAEAYRGRCGRILATMGTAPESVDERVPAGAPGAAGSPHSLRSDCELA